MRSLPASLALVAGGVALGLACASDPLHAGSSEVAPPVLPPTYDPMRSFAPLVEALQPSVVHVFTAKTVSVPEELERAFPFFFGPDGAHPGLEREQVQEGQGSGFVISADGEIVTNNHVVEGARSVRVKFHDGRELPAKVVGTDPRTDVALIRVESDTPLQPLALGSSTDIKVGDWVVAIGNPFGLSHTVTAGIVSAKGRVIGATTYDDFIQTDAAINVGNSGGPLLDVQGRAVGINTAIAGQGTGIAFAVPIDMVREVLEDLRTTGKVARGWLGIKMQPVDPDLAEALDIEGGKGALVTEVYPDTPAAKGGLEKGDVVTTIDGQAVEDSAALLRAVGRHRPGDSVNLGVIREGRARILDLTLAERPDEELLARGVYQAPDAPEEDARAADASSDLERLGIELGPAPAAGRSITGKGRAPASRVAITAVDADGPAHGKLEAGDVVLEINRKPVSSVQEARVALRGSGEVALFLVEREGESRFVALRPRASR